MRQKVTAAREPSVRARIAPRERRIERVDATGAVLSPANRAVEYIARAVNAEIRRVSESTAPQILGRAPAALQPARGLAAGTAKHGNSPECVRAARLAGERQDIFRAAYTALPEAGSQCKEQQQERAQPAWGPEISPRRWRRLR